jgi:hypothetical protein
METVPNGAISNSELLKITKHQVTNMSQDSPTAISNGVVNNVLDESKQDPKPNDTEPINTTIEKTWKLWAIFPPLCIANLLMALESTVTSTSLPVITADLHAGNNYVWFLNAFLATL